MLCPLNCFDILKFPLYDDNIFADADRARKHGMDEFISADPCKFAHHALFQTLQTTTLDHRLNDPYCSLVRINAILIELMSIFSAQWVI